MRRFCLSIALAVCAVFSGFASAEGIDFAAGDLKSAQAAYPPCALKCMAEFIPKSECNVTDVECLCTNVPLNGNITVCATGKCILEELLTTQNVSNTMCGVPVRDHSHLPGLIGVVGGIVALVFFVVRMLACLPGMGRVHGADDYTIAVAVALTVPPTVFAVYLGRNGLGKDIWTLPLGHIENVLFYYFLGELFYVVAQSLIKLSVVWFILRVFPNSKTRMACWIIMAFTAAYGFTFLMVTIFQCWPIDYAWLRLDEANVTEGRCNNENLQGWLSAMFNIILDLAILILPLRELYALQMGIKQKAMVMGMFGLGIFVTIVSIIRLRSLISFANSHNITWDYMEAAYWSTIELDVGIVIACLPAARAFCARLGRKTLTTIKNSSSLSGSRTMDGKQNLSNVGRSQQAPRSGDERDFIPLMDVELGESDKRRLEKGATADSAIKVTTEAFHHAGSASDADSLDTRRPGNHNYM